MDTSLESCVIPYLSSLVSSDWLFDLLHSASLSEAACDRLVRWLGSTWRDQSLERGLTLFRSIFECRCLTDREDVIHSYSDFVGKHSERLAAFLGKSDNVSRFQKLPARARGLFLEALENVREQSQTVFLCSPDTVWRVVRAAVPEDVISRCQAHSLG